MILTTHDMSDIEALANRIILIGKGQVLYDGELDTIKNKYITHKTLIVDHHPTDHHIQYEGADIIQQSHGRIQFSVDIKLINVSDLITYLAKHLDIIDITVDNPSVDDIIVDMYKAYEI